MIGRVGRWRFDEEQPLIMIQPSNHAGSRYKVDMEEQYIDQSKFIPLLPLLSSVQRLWLDD